MVKELYILLLLALPLSALSQQQARHNSLSGRYVVDRGGNYCLLEDFGGKADGTVLASLSISGDTIVSETAVFHANDVGKLISIDSTSLSGLTTYTIGTVVEFISNFSVRTSTLPDQYSTGQKGFMGTDNSQPFRDAFASCETVTLGAGIYLVKTRPAGYVAPDRGHVFEMTTGQSLIGAGKGVTVIRRADADTVKFRRIIDTAPGAENILFRDFTLNANKEGTRYVEAGAADGLEQQHGLYIESSSTLVSNVEVKNSNGDGMNIRGGVGLTVENCDIHDTYRLGINVSLADRATIKNCNFYNMVRGSVGAEQNSPDPKGNIKILDCNFFQKGAGFQGLTTGGGITINGLIEEDVNGDRVYTMKNILVQNCTFEGMFKSISGFQGIENYTIRDCTIEGGMAPLIVTSFSSDTLPRSKGLLIDNLTIKSKRNAPANTVASIFLNSIDGLTIRNSRVTLDSSFHIARFQQCWDVTIENCDFTAQDKGIIFWRCLNPKVFSSRFEFRDTAAFVFQVAGNNTTSYPIEHAVFRGNEMVGTATDRYFVQNEAIGNTYYEYEGEGSVVSNASGYFSFAHGCGDFIPSKITEISAENAGVSYTVTDQVVTATTIYAQLKSLGTASAYTGPATIKFKLN